MKVCFVKIHPNTILAHDRFLMDHPVVYLIHRSEIKCFIIAKGQYSFNADDVLILCPRYYTICLVLSSSYNGRFDSNPFNFYTFRL